MVPVLLKLKQSWFEWTFFHTAPQKRFLLYEKTVHFDRYPLEWHLAIKTTVRTDSDRLTLHKLWQQQHTSCLNDPSGHSYHLNRHLTSSTPPFLSFLDIQTSASVTCTQESPQHSHVASVCVLEKGWASYTCSLTLCVCVCVCVCEWRGGVPF